MKHRHSDARPRIHIWPQRARSDGGRSHYWSQGPNGPRWGGFPTAGAALDAALAEIGVAGAVVILEPSP